MHLSLRKDLRKLVCILFWSEPWSISYWIRFLSSHAIWAFVVPHWLQLFLRLVLASGYWVSYLGQDRHFVSRNKTWHWKLLWSCLVWLLVFLCLSCRRARVSSLCALTLLCWNTVGMWLLVPWRSLPAWCSLRCFLFRDLDRVHSRSWVIIMVQRIRIV